MLLVCLPTRPKGFSLPVQSPPCIQEAQERFWVSSLRAAGYCALCLLLPSLTDLFSEKKPGEWISSLRL